MVNTCDVYSYGDANADADICGDVQHPLAVHAEYEAGVVPQDQELDVEVGLGFQFLRKKEVLVDPHHDPLNSFLHLHLHLQAFVNCKNLPKLLIGDPWKTQWALFSPVFGLVSSIKAN